MAARDGLVLSAVAGATYYGLATYGPGWWRGARLPDVDPPLDLRWLHDGFAWTAQYVGTALYWLFAATAGLLVVGAAVRRSWPRLERAAVAVPAVALLAVPALAVAWFVATQVALVIAPLLGMYHGEARPAVP
jgi:hypothetical protein